MAEKTITINRFNGGIANDRRSNNPTKCSLVSHFDAFTYPHKLVPRESTEDKESGATDIVKFLYADRSGVQTLWGFDKNGSNRCLVKYFNGTGWVEYANNESSSETRQTEDEKVFFHYKGYIYMWAGGTKLKRFDTDSGTAFEDDVIANVFTDNAVTYTTLAQPVHHPVDDIAYFFADNIVYSLNDTTWTDKTLELPDNLEIVGACAYGNYLAIACTTKAGITTGVKSTVYLWDRDSSLVEVDEVIDYGDGFIKYIATLNNKLIVVMEVENGRKIVVKGLNGRFGQVINELTIDEAAVFTASSQVVDNRLHFPMKAPRESDNRLGIWAVDEDGKMTLDFVHSTATSFEGIYWTGDIWWMAHTNDGSISRSVSGSSAGTAVYKTLIIGKEEMNNTLLSVGVMTNPLPATANNVKLEYLVESDTNWDTDTWVTIFNKGTRFKTYHEAVNIESDGSALGEFRLLKLKVTLTNASGVHLTGIKVRYEEKPDNLN